MFDFADHRERRSVSLTPMIDVVFLLLVFFMLVGRFGVERPFPLALAGGGAAYEGPPRLVDVGVDGWRLNGVAMESRPLLLELVRLTKSGGDTVIVRPADGVNLDRLVDALELMRRAGFTNLAIVEPRE